MVSMRTAFASQAARTRSAHRFLPRVEELETRNLLSATGVAGLEDVVAAPASLEVIPHNGVIATSGSGLSPTMIRAAYGFDKIKLSNGAIGDGAGQTIAIVTAFNAPNIESDLRTFNRNYGLPDVPKFTKVSPYGTNGTSGLWSLECALDVQWAHAIAPKANILLVQAKSDSLSDLLAAVNYARRQSGVSVVSMSWGTSEFTSQGTFNRIFTTPTGKAEGVSFVAASGDDGSRAASSWPSVSTNVLAVGGTTLTVGTGGSYVRESGWAKSSGLVSKYEAMPTYQSGFVTGTKRGAPDVAYNANASTGFWVYSSVPYAGRSGWFLVGGTSAGAPQWAGLIAIANQGRALQGLKTLENVQSLVYKMPGTHFHDITSGSNGAYTAKAGYDYVTGRGSPYADRVVSYLISSNSTSLTSATTSLAMTSISGTTVRPSFVGNFDLNATQAANGTSADISNSDQTLFQDPSLCISSCSSTMFSYGECSEMKRFKHQPAGVETIALQESPDIDDADPVEELQQEEASAANDEYEAWYDDSSEPTDQLEQDLIFGNVMSQMRRVRF